MWGALGGEIAEKLVRSAFACTIKHAGLTQEFIRVVQSIDEVLEKSMHEKIMQNFIKKWAAASRMRTWLVEKRKDVDDIAERSRFYLIFVIILILFINKYNNFLYKDNKQNKQELIKVNN